MKESPGSTTEDNTSSNQKKPSWEIDEDQYDEYLRQWDASDKAMWKVVELVRVNIEFVSGRIYYLTFQAKDDDSAVCDFQAKVWWTLSGQPTEEGFRTEVMMCGKKKT